MKEWTMYLDTLELKSMTQDSVWRPRSAPGTGTPNPELSYKPESASSTLEKLINVIHCDHNFYTESVS